MAAVWKSVFASVIGSAHADLQQVCQDACHVHADADYWVGVVSDGAGSASFGGEGARYVVEHLSAMIGAIAPSEVNLPLLTSCVVKVRQTLCDLAMQASRSPRDYACTLLLAVIAEQQAWFVQIGDGAMVVNNGNTLGVVFWPEQGMYANMTHFLTDATALEYLQTCSVNIRVMEIALLSDGLQRLALNFAQQTAHPDFFSPMWQQLRRHQSVALLQQQLQIFLHSDKVNGRTDDDKTLVLATRLLVDDA
jgi:hypothetical protein